MFARKHWIPSGTLELAIFEKPAGKRQKHTTFVVALNHSYLNPDRQGEDITTTVLNPLDLLREADLHRIAWEFILEEGNRQSPIRNQFVDSDPAQTRGLFSGGPPMITLKFLCYLWQLLKDDKGFDVGVLGTIVVAVCWFGWMISLPLIALDLLVLLVVTVNRISNAIRSKLAEQRARELRIRQEAEEADRFHKAQELARIEANSLANQRKRAEAIAALEPAANQIRRFWAKHHLILNDEFSLRQLNEEIRTSVSEASPFESLQKLAFLKDSMIRKVVRFETEQLYEKWYEYISEAVPREEFDRLMQEAEQQSRTADEYGRRLIELGEFLSEAAGPAAVKWHQEQESDRVADYEALFTEEGESPFDEAEEDESASRVG